MSFPLSQAPLFQGISEEEIAALLACLGAQQRRFKKGAVIFAEGTATESIGLVLSGMAIVSSGDLWGNVSILGHVPPGSVFAEAYACIPGQPLLITVTAAEDTELLLLRAGRILSPCAQQCPFHARLGRNLLSICAHKSLQLSQKILHTSPKSIRGRLMSYFSQCARQCAGSAFSIPYNRQQLADYLNVERSALCAELSRMRRDGLIEYRKNFIRLRT